ncbi:MAG: antitoxin Xre-like helix-turn-helix domain-containing protein [Hyphomicrobiaceae bacterium]
MKSATIEKRSEANQLAAVLGLQPKKNLSDLDLVAHVERGFPAKSVEAIIRHIDPDGHYLQISDIIPKSTYHRRTKAKQPLTTDESARLFALAKVFIELFNRQYRGRPDLGLMFLIRAHPLLEGRRPIDIAKESTAGADLVLKLLLQADAGVAV